MISLLKLHWRLIRQPSKCLREEIPSWSVQIGIILNSFSILYLTLSNPQTTNWTAFTANYYGLPNQGIILAYFLGLQALSIVVTYYLMPRIIRWSAGIPKEEFEAALYRKIIFYAPTSNVIYSVIFLLPLQVISAALLLNSNLAMIAALFSLLYGLVSLWGMVPAINGIVIVFKGLHIHYGFRFWKVILVQFIIPLLILLPLAYPILRVIPAFLKAQIQ